jgi:hypothetical protein
MTGRSLPMGMVLLIVCLAGFVAAPGLAVEMTIAGMGAANVVSGTAQINVTAPGAPDGYVVLKVDGEFVAAQAPPFGLVWNTREVDDGQHEVAVHEVSADGQIVDRATEVVRVQNRANVTAPVTLEYKFQEGDELTYAIEGRSDVRELQQDKSYELVPWTLYGAMAGNISAQASETIASIQGGSAVIDRMLTEGSVDFPEVVSRLLGVGRPTQFTVSPAGEIKDGPGTVNAESKFAGVWLGLPQGAVRQGHKWTSPIVAQFEVQDGRTQAVDADHEIIEFVREGGVDCALIQSTYRQKLPIDIEIYGNRQTLDDVFVVGERLTYFAIETGRIVRVEDSLLGEFSAKSAEYGLYAITRGPTVPGAAGPTTRTVPETINLQLSLELTVDLNRAA